MPSLPERLAKEAQAFLEERRGLRRNVTTDVFETRLYIRPDDLRVVNYLRSKPLAAFNPGALLKGSTLYVFPRLVFDYYCYCSSVGVFALDVERVVEGRLALEEPLETRIVLWPQEPWEFGHGCEDARAFEGPDGGLGLLYTGSKHYTQDGQLVKKSVLALAEFDEGGGEAELNFRALRLKRRGFFSARDGHERWVPDNKDSAVVRFLDARRAVLLTRPDVPRPTPDGGKLQLGWRAEADLQGLTLSKLEPVLPFEPWELKVGWSTNVVPLRDDEYLVGWHGVLRDDLSYRNGLALVDAEGRLKAISDYVLAPRGLNEGYGDRPLVIFGCGLVLFEDFLIWVGGLSDYALGLFVVKRERALGTLR